MADGMGVPRAPHSSAGTRERRPRQVVTVHLDETSIRIFQRTELITTVPPVTRKEVVVRKSGEHNRRKIV
jgi:hypothetical protein